MSKNNTIISFLLVVFLSCEGGHLTDCKKCSPGEIGDVRLEIYLTSDKNYPSQFVVTIYEGVIEDSLLISRFTTQSAYCTFDAMLYKNYTVSAEFNLHGKHYILIDAACPQLKYDETSCDEPCYFVYDNIIDLRLRYH